MKRTCIEICAGAGGQALGLHRAGFRHLALVENDPRCAETLRQHEPWSDAVWERDVSCPTTAAEIAHLAPTGCLDLLAGGVPCPPFSRAGKQLGGNDDRDLFPFAVRLVGLLRPRAVLLENVRGLLDAKFDEYRHRVIFEPLRRLGYEARAEIVNAADFGVPQARQRAIIVAIRRDDAQNGSSGRSIFSASSAEWPSGSSRHVSVGEALRDEMGRGGWPGVEEWASRAAGVAPALVGGSKKHGGPDLGPTQARAQWERLGVNGKLVKTEPPSPDHEGLPYLSVRMAAIIQGFPAEWPFQGSKTHAYRQVGNAFPPPVAQAFGEYIQRLLCSTSSGAPRRRRSLMRSASQQGRLRA